MSATDRLRTEECFHDAQAATRAATFAAEPLRLLVDDDDYLDHETWIRPAFDRLGDVSGRQVLDWGCGHGIAAVVLARRGARVTACDLSGGYMRETQARARANDVVVRCVQADAQRTPFGDATFDAVWGHAILHHLDLASGVAELRRILKPNGIAVLCEPWDENPVLRAARRFVPYGGKDQTPEEAPLRQRNLASIHAFFRSVDVKGFQFLGMLRRVAPHQRLRTWLDRGDEQIFGRWPGLRRFGRYVVLTLRP